MIIEKAILELFPDAVPNQDFYVVNDGDGPVIRNWEYPAPVPTESELQTAWEKVQNKPKELTPLEKLEEKQQLMQKAIDDIILGGMF